MGWAPEVRHYADLRRMGITAYFENLFGVGYPDISVRSARGREGRPGYFRLARDPTGALEFPNAEMHHDVRQIQPTTQAFSRIPRTGP
jgi:hypothetical protein